MTPVFVFGSNLAGRHGKGAALFAAQNRGAQYGNGIGRQGNAYAIPTKDGNLKALSIERIKWYVDCFISYAQSNPTERFEVTRIGCGLAGYKDHQIAPLFRGAPSNCDLPAEWVALLAQPEGNEK